LEYEISYDVRPTIRVKKALAVAVARALYVRQRHCKYIPP
jgi:hypothetical protein